MYGNAVGFDNSYNLIPGVVIYCTSGSKIYNYAQDNGITTKALTSAPADPSAKLKVPSIDNAVISGIKAKSYTGKAVKQSPVVKVNGVTLTAGTDYTLSYKNNVNVGTAKVTINGKGSYKGSKTLSFKIKKAKNTMTAKGKSPAVEYLKLKNSSRTIKAAKAIAVKKAKGKLTYKIAKKNNSFTVAKSGKITVKKGLKKGTYKLKIKVTAGGNKNYKSLTKTVTVKIQVK